MFKLLIEYGGDVIGKMETGDFLEDIARNPGVKDEEFFEFVRAQGVPMILDSASMRRVERGYGDIRA